MTALSDMPEALFETDTLSLYRRAHAQVTRHGAAYIRHYGQLTFTELTRYEVLRGLPRKPTDSSQPLSTLARSTAFCHLMQRRQDDPQTCGQICVPEGSRLAR